MANQTKEESNTTCRKSSRRRLPVFLSLMTLPIPQTTLEDSPHTRNKNKNASALLAAAVSAKIEDGNIRSAVKIICSEDKPAENSSEIPSCPPNIQLLRLAANHQQLRTALQHCRCQRARFSRQSDRFLQAPRGAGSGPGGFRPQHLLDLFNSKETGPRCS